jgi:hypothetical protein
LERQNAFYIHTRPYRGFAGFNYDIQHTRDLMVHQLINVKGIA